MDGLSSSQNRFGIEFSLAEHGADCLIWGWPGVEIIGPTERNRFEGASCSLRRTEEKPARIEMEPGDFAHSVVTFLDDDGAEAPDYLRVDVPEVHWGKAFVWQWDAALCHNAATHPGTYVSAIRSGPIPSDQLVRE